MDVSLKDIQYRRFCAYGFLKNLRFYDAFFLLFLLDHGISYSQIGLLYAARELVINISEIPSGIIADTYGRKRALIGAFFLYILSFVIFYFSGDFYLFMLAMILNGLGDSFRSGTHKGMIMDYLKSKNWQQHKINYYGHTRSWSQLGSAISALVAGVLVLYSGDYRIIFLGSIVPYILNFINIYTYPKYLNYSKDKTVLNKTSLFSNIKSFWAILKQRQVFTILHSSAIYSAYLKSIKDYIQPIMVQLAIALPIVISLDEKRQSGLVIGILYFIIFIATSIASKNANLFVQKNTSNRVTKTLLLGLVFGALCGGLILKNYWITTLMLFTFIYMIENIRKPILTGYLSDEVPNELLTSVLSAQSFYKTILTSILAILLGVFTDLMGIGYAFMIISMGLITTTLLLEFIQGYSMSFQARP